MATTRKLFLAHAGELANRLAHAVGHAGVIADFVRAYAGRHNRPGLLRDPAQLHEIHSTIGREALMVMAVEIERLVPAAFVFRRRAAPRPEESALAESFRAEFLASLARTQEWSAADAAERQAFTRDLNMYRHWRRRERKRADSQTLPGVESPFADRAALLLDPSMMEQARRAASALEGELMRLSARIFASLGRAAARGTARAARKSPRRAAPRAHKAPPRPARKTHRSVKPRRRKARRDR
jgi:hypothetical protein